MKSEIYEAELLDLTTLIKRGITPKYVETDGICVLNQKCIRDQKVSFEFARQTSKEKKITDEKLLQDYDVLVNSTGVGTLGRVAQIYELNQDVTVDSHITIVRGDEKKVDKKYFGYLVKNKQKAIEALAEGSTGQTELSRILLGQIKVQVHKSNIKQKKIAHILSTLDDKIELNRKMNQTLEEMAQALFKSWFVDFNPVKAKASCSSDEELEAVAKELGISKEILELFPSEFEDSELGMIPKGWNWKKITEVCTKITSGGTPKRKESDNFNGSINWFTTKELNNSFVLDSIEKITEKGLHTSSAKLFPINTVVMAIYAAPTVGRLGILTEESSFNQAACGFIADEMNISYEFLFLFLQDRNAFLNNLANGAAQQNLNVGIVKNLNVPIPDKAIMNSFKNIIENIFNRLKNNIQEIQTLQKTRDTLLPKLLSGEIDVSNIEVNL